MRMLTNILMLGTTAICIAVVLNLTKTLQQSLEEFQKNAAIAGIILFGFIASACIVSVILNTLFAPKVE